MGLLLLQFRKMNLIQDQNNVEYQLVDLNQQLNDIQSMSATLANDSVTLSDIAGMPASLFSSGVDSMNYAYNYAMQYANTVMANMNNASVFAQFGNNAQHMKEIAFMKAYEQGRAHIRKKQQAALNQQEKQIQMKKTKLEARLACIEEELKGISQRLPNAVSNSISGFSLQA